MIQKRSSVIIPNIDQYNTDQFIISLKVSSSCFVCCLQDDEKKMIIALETWDIHTQDEFFDITSAAKLVLEQSDILKFKIKQGIIIIDNDKYTLLPEVLYTSGEDQKYLEFNNINTFNEVVYSYSINKISSKIIYSYPKGLENIFSPTIAKLKCIHLIDVLMNTCFSINNEKENVLIHISGKRIDMVITKMQSLLFCNSFHFETAEEFIFYVLNVYKQLNLNTETIPVSLMGDIEKESAIYGILYKFIRNINFIKHHTSIQLSNEFNNESNHSMSVLINSFLCV